MFSPKKSYKVATPLVFASVSSRFVYSNSKYIGVRFCSLHFPSCTQRAAVVAVLFRECATLAMRHFPARFPYRPIAYYWPWNADASTPSWETREAVEADWRKNSNAGSKERCRRRTVKRKMENKISSAFLAFWISWNIFRNTSRHVELV